MRSISLLELIIVMVIIAIVATFAMPAYRVTQERALDKEAIANLKLIQAAEKIYKMETNSYYPSSGSTSDIDAINQNLKLSLPSASTRNWNYAVWSSGCARATRNVSSGRSWYLIISASDPSSGAGCP